MIELRVARGYSASSLVVKEKEKLVLGVGNGNGTTDVAAILIESYVVLDSGRTKRSGIEAILAVEFVERTMELPAATFGVNCEKNARITAILGGKVIALDLELANRVHTELGVLPIVGADIRIHRAVKKKVIVAAAKSVHMERTSD